MLSIFASAAGSLLNAAGNLYNAVKNGNLEREEAKTMVSASYSGLVSFAWNLQFSKPVVWLGMQGCFRDGAVAMFRVLDYRITEESAGMMTLAVPKEMLDTDLQARFQVEEKTK